MKDLRDLRVWQKAHRIAIRVYKETSTFPREETYGMTSQIGRASVSVAANIVEGTGRSGDVEMARFFQIAFGSACELEYHLLLSKDLRYLGVSEYEEMESEVVELKKMLATFLKKLKAGS